MNCRPNVWPVGLDSDDFVNLRHQNRGGGVGGEVGGEEQRGSWLATFEVWAGHPIGLLPHDGRFFNTKIG